MFLRTMRILVTGLFLLTGMASCIDDIDLENQLHETKKLVLYCRLCPQLDATEVHLSHSKLLYTENNTDTLEVIRDAVVELSDDNVHWIRMAYNETDNRYVLTHNQFPIEEGRTYYIRASYGDYKTIQSQCTVPYTRHTNPHFETVEAINDNHEGVIYNCAHTDSYLVWQDYPGEENYYMCLQMMEDSDDEYSISYAYTLQCQDNGTWTDLFTDEERDGKQIRVMNDYDIYWDYSKESEHLFLLSLDKNCYLYEKTVTSADGFFNAFLLEPQHTYTNIENGFGLFGAFVMEEISR